MDESEIRENKWEWNILDQFVTDAQKAPVPKQGKAPNGSVPKNPSVAQTPHSAQQQAIRNSGQPDILQRSVKLEGGAATSTQTEKSRVVTAAVAMTKEKRPDRRSAVDRVASKPRHWSEEEDRLLRAAVLHYGNKHWKKIAERVPGRNHTQCLQRWSKVLAPGLKKGQWSPSEDATLVALAKEQLANCKDKENPEHKKKLNWGMISKQITGRTAKQCRERWVNNLNPEIRKGGWTPEEDKKILELFEMFPKKWAMISKNLEGRTENAVKIRYKSLTRNMNAAKAKTTAIAHTAQAPLGPQIRQVAPSVVPSSRPMPKPMGPQYSKPRDQAYSKVPHASFSGLIPEQQVKSNMYRAQEVEVWPQGFNEQNNYPSEFAEEPFTNDLDDFFSPAILNMGNTQTQFQPPLGQESYGQELRQPDLVSGSVKYKKEEIARRSVAFEDEVRDGSSNYVQRLDSLITSFDDMKSQTEPEPSPPQVMSHKGGEKVPSNGGAPSQSTFDFYRSQAEQMDQKSSNKKRKPRNTNYNLLRKAISGEALEFEVGDNVVHEVRGQGKVLEFDLNNRRGKPYKVCFANGETHEYSIAQVREKLKKCTINPPQDPGTSPFSPFSGSGSRRGTGRSSSYGQKPGYHASTPFGSNRQSMGQPNESWITNKSNISDPTPSKFLSEQGLNNFELQQLIELDDSDFDALYSQQPVKF